MMGVERFGWDWYRNPAHPTSDAIIPAVWAARSLATLDALTAQAQLHLAHGVAHGAALALSGKDAGVRRHTDDLRRSAFPKVFDPLPDPEPSDD